MRPDDIGIRRNSDGRFPQIVPRVVKRGFCKGGTNPPLVVVEDEERIGRELGLLLSRHRQGVLEARDKAYRLMAEAFGPLLR